jgi:hypothetical protein
MQANEHPSLCSLREFLTSKQNVTVGDKKHVLPYTTESDAPTPIIVMVFAVSQLNTRKWRDA